VQRSCGCCRNGALTARFPGPQSAITDPQSALRLAFGLAREPLPPRPDQFPGSTRATLLSFKKIEGCES
jgi:hypothetical protein